MYNKKKIEEIFKEMDYRNIHSVVVEFIKDKVADKSVIIGLSGGIDSALTCSLAIDALGKERVKVLVVKNIRYSDQNLSIAKAFAHNMGISIIEIDSNNIREQFLSRVEFDKENIRQIASLDARITDLLIRSVASKENRIYLGTINGTERLTGWYPKGSLFGDFCPIGGLIKHQVQQLARFQNLPDGIIDSVSGDASRVCSGCGELPEFKGISYDVLDIILYMHETERPEDYVRKLSSLGISQDEIKVVLNRIVVAKNKSEVFCPYPKINF